MNTPTIRRLTLSCRHQLAALAPTQPVKELVCAIGRGGGKDSVASFLATYLAASFDPSGKLRPGERAFVLSIAVDKNQASITHRYIAGYFEQTPALASLVTHVGPTSIELRNGVTIETIVNSYRSVRGRSILAAIFDEMAFWRSEDFANPDVETFNAVSPGLARVPGSMLFIISSVHKAQWFALQKDKGFSRQKRRQNSRRYGFNACIQPFI